MIGGREGEGRGVESTSYLLSVPTGNFFECLPPGVSAGCGVCDPQMGCMSDSDCQRGVALPMICGVVQCSCSGRGLRHPPRC